MNDHAREFLKAYIRWAYAGLFTYNAKIDYKDAHDVEVKIFDCFIGNMIHTVYYLMTDQKIDLTKGNNIYTNDPIFSEIIQEVIDEYDQ